MLAYLVRRISLVCLVLFGVFTIVLFLQHLSGDPIELLLPMDASQEVRREMRHAMGLDQPLSFQYLRLLTNTVQGNLSESSKFKQPPLWLVLERVPNTVLLAGSSLPLTLVLPIRLGIIVAVFRKSWIDAATTGASLVGQANRCTGSGFFSSCCSASKSAGSHRGGAGR